MRIYRDHFYKQMQMKNWMIIVFFCLVLIISCKGKKEIEFCEGMNPDGKGERCGIKFESGEMTLIFKSKEPFETDRLVLVRKKLQDKHYEDFGSETHEVRPDEQRLTIPLALYQAGQYHIEILKGENKIGEGDVEIVDPALDSGAIPARAE